MTEHFLSGIGWHIEAQLAEAYAASRTDPVLTASLEQHLVWCAECRAQVGGLVSPAALDATWSEVLERVERPVPRPLERLLGRLGVAPPTARLLALTPSLRGAWLAGVVLVLGLVLVVAYSDPHGIACFLAVAPVLPAVGVAVAFGPATDPTHELAAAAPYSSLRLLALRTALVVASTIVPAAVAGVLLPGSAWSAVAWLLPAFALASCTLAVGTHISPLATVVVLSAVWIGLTAPGLAPTGDPRLAAEPLVQFTCLALFLVSTAALVRERRDLPELIRRTA